jgi:hypothetical protein
MLAPRIAHADCCCGGDYVGGGGGPVGTPQLEIGLVSRSFANNASQGFGTMSLGGATSMFEANGDGGMDHARGLYGRGSVALGHFQMSFDLELAKIDPAAMTIDDKSFGWTPMIMANGGTELGMSTMLGLGTKLDDSVFLGAELVGGVRLVDYSFAAQMDDDHSTATIWAFAPILEARAHAAVWVSDTMNVNAFVGQSLLDDGKIMGIALGFADRAFGA